MGTPQGQVHTRTPVRGVRVLPINYAIDKMWQNVMAVKEVEPVLARTEQLNLDTIYRLAKSLTFCRDVTNYIIILTRLG